ncbi:nucleoside triphosphate pyrophosphohydrolase [Granulosicoccaceae sp. 1_MG-2023]|nr:nucleoside triphosphate pyrophosphohydrolase [Granulosicoccaceae sp. 1_MG-2023]
MSSIEPLLDIMARLRDPQNGCPWDLKQNFRSVAPYTVEEAYEVADAIERGDLDDLRDELGDLLFQVVFHARMAEEAKAFGFDDVVDAVCEKLVRRHPHVFATPGALSEDEVNRRWEEEKAAERERKYGQADASALSGITAGLPPLLRAEKLQRKAARVGFDWPDCKPVLAKIREELEEVEEAMAAADQDHTEAEIGDLLFAVVNLARHCQLDAGTALSRTNAKFTRRFQAIEQALQAEGRDMQSATLEEMEAIWQAVKKTQG